MEAAPTKIPEVLILEPKVFEDKRGFFLESFNQIQWEKASGIKLRFVQDNHSRSAKNVLRGLHYQVEQIQGKLIRVLQGEIFDVAVDLRKSSPTFGKWVGTKLNAVHHQQLWIPPGFAHGFLILSDTADVFYKTTDYYAPKHDRTLLWNDPDLAIDWPLSSEPILSEKDRLGTPFKQAELFT